LQGFQADFLRNCSLKRSRVVIKAVVDRGNSRGTKTGASASIETEAISARGLEILRVLNDVFNTVPADGGEWQEDTETDRATVIAGF
jgi:uncharacterized lipoprotein YajG